MKILIAILALAGSGRADLISESITNTAKGSGTLYTNQNSPFAIGDDQKQHRLHSDNAGNLYANTNPPGVTGSAAVSGSITAQARVSTVLPGSTGNGLPVSIMADKLGRVAVNGGPRERRDCEAISFSTATEHAILSPGPVGIYLDAVMIFVSNGGTNVNTGTIRSVSGGSDDIQFSLAANGGGFMMMLPNDPYPQTTPASGWSIDMVDAVVGGEIFVNICAIEDR